MRRLSDQGMTIILTSHSSETVAKLCSRALLFHGGSLVADGPAQKVMDLYRDKAKPLASDPFRARIVGAGMGIPTKRCSHGHCTESGDWRQARHAT